MFLNFALKILCLLWFDSRTFLFLQEFLYVIFHGQRWFFWSIPFEGNSLMINKKFSKVPTNIRRPVAVWKFTFEKGVHFPSSSPIHISLFEPTHFLVWEEVIDKAKNFLMSSLLKKMTNSANEHNKDGKIIIFMPPRNCSVPYLQVLGRQIDCTEMPKLSIPSPHTYPLIAVIQYNFVLSNLI